MKSKITSLFVASLLVAALLISFASALSLSSSSTSLNQNNNQTSLLLTNNNNATQNITLTIPNIVEGSNQVTLVVFPSQINSLAPSATSSITVSATSFPSNLKFGEHSATLTATGIDSTTGSAVSTATSTITYLKSFCKSGENGNSDADLEITRVKVDSTGTDNEIWKPLDEVTIDIKVRNNGDKSVKKVLVELGIFDSNGRNVVGDLNFDTSDNEQYSVGSVSDSTTEDIQFKFTVPADFEEGSYKLAVKAFSDDVGESKICTDTSSDLSNTYFEDISVEKQDDKGKFIALTNIKSDPEEISCGETVLLTLDAFNVGTEDQDQVKITVLSKALNLSSSYEIKNNLNQGDKQTLSFSFTIPEGIENKVYSLELFSQYDYRSGSAEYRQKSDSSVIFPLKVIGCSVTPSAPKVIATISASLDSEAKAGQPLKVKSIITNAGSSSATFAIGASGFDSWATLDSISQRIITLGSGESKEVDFVFTIGDSVSGDQSFVIQVASGANIETREVAVNIAAKSSGFAFNFGDSTLIWVIGIVNVLLIILIIVVAVRISRR